MPNVPDRPLLLPHALARRHLVGDTRLIVIHDTEHMLHHRVSERTWAVLSAMDGTRDIHGLVASAGAVGLTVTAEEVVELVAELAAGGLVGERANAPAKASSAGPAPASSAARDRELLHLPGFALACDGAGTCCRFYPSIVFSPLDAARARAHRPEVLSGGVSERRVFLPMAGASREMLAVTLVDGRCVYLEKDLACGIHAASSADQKPLGCRTYPARFVDDGAAIRIAPWLECGCVIRSGAEPQAGGAPLVPAAMRTRSELDPAYFIEALPESISVGSKSEASRAELVQFADALADAPLADDGVAVFVALSHVLETHGLDVTACRAALAAPPPADAALFSGALRAFTPRAERLAAETWRDPKDLVRTTATALAGAATLASSLGEDLLRGPGSGASAERFYVRTVLFGHQLVQAKGRRPMSLLAFDRAFRLLLARALRVVASLAELTDPAFAWPIALVEATLRGYGLSAYVRDIAIDSDR